MMTGAEMEMEQDIKKFIGGDYLRGFIPMKGDVSDYANDDDPDRISDGALVEHRPHFADIWRRYDAQLQTTNGMDLDTFPGCSMLVDAYPINMSDPTTGEEAMIIYELVDLALDIYNHDESNVCMSMTLLRSLLYFSLSVLQVTLIIVSLPCSFLSTSSSMLRK
ncbi:uncharacterized protein [Solanum tuberosum]|uniref:uncharacterized protein n=1 Tax=Solanum tuberosum TaxID=4113 RepID=UPI00073A46B2|nr:PREDICTED: uncharacterized protein LOC102579908 [Solanum tuberosum]